MSRFKFLLFHPRTQYDRLYWVKVPSFSGLVILFIFSFVFFCSFLIFYFQTSYAFQWRYDDVNDSVIIHLFFIFFYALRVCIKYQTLARLY